MKSEMKLYSDHFIKLAKPKINAIGECNIFYDTV